MPSLRCLLVHAGSAALIVVTAEKSADKPAPKKRVGSGACGVGSAGRGIGCGFIGSGV